MKESPPNNGLKDKVYEPFFWAAILLFYWEGLRVIRAFPNSEIPQTLQPFTSHLLIVGEILFDVAIFVNVIFILSKFDAVRKLFNAVWMRCNYLIKADRAAVDLVPLWGRYVTQGANTDVWGIRHAVQNEYLQEERLDLSGQADLDSRNLKEGDHTESRPLLVTNFVRYSKLVEAVVNSATNTYSGQRGRVILCVTTLSMKLEKWFNFDEETCCSHDDWQAYLEFLQTNIVPRTDLILARVLLVHNDGVLHKSKRIKLQSLLDLKNELKSHIWLSKKGSDTVKAAAPLELVPLPWRDDRKSYITRKAVFDQLHSEFDTTPDLKASLDTLSTRADKNRHAYVILPSSSFPTSPCCEDGGKFAGLGSEYLKRFHTAESSGKYYAYYKVVDPGRYLPTLGSVTAHLPLDFYYVAVIERSTTEGMSPSSLAKIDHRGLFCLAATPDENLNMTHLYLVDPERSPSHFKEIEKYVRELLTDPKFVSDLLL